MHMHAYTHTHTHIHIHTHIHTYIYIHTHTHTQTQTRTHTHTNTHTYKYTHTHTHTHLITLLSPQNPKENYSLFSVLYIIWTATGKLSEKQTSKQANEKNVQGKRIARNNFSEIMGVVQLFGTIYLQKVHTPKKGSLVHFKKQLIYELFKFKLLHTELSHLVLVPEVKKRR